MKTYISLLRGINVSGQKIIKMRDIKEMFENMGFENVETYIQSGNIIFRSENTNCRQLAEKIAAEILKSTGFEVPGIVLDLEELREIINKNPYSPDNKKKIDHLHVTILSSLPLSIDFEKINTKKGKDEEFSVQGKSVYLYLPNGYGRTKLTNNFFENIFKVTATTRNWKTMVEINKMAEK